MPRLSLEPLEQRMLLAITPLTAEMGVSAQVASLQQTFSQSPAPMVAMDADGEGVAVWASRDQDGSGWGVFGQRFDRHGQTLGSEFQVNTETANHQTLPSVAMDPGGDFVVTWSSLPQDHSGYGVYAQRYSPTGEPLGEEFRVNEHTAGNQNFSAVAMDADGDFVIVWTSQDQDGDRSGVFARRYDDAGTALGGEFQVNATVEGHQRYPAVGMSGAGDFVVTWTSQDQDGDSGGIIARLFDAGGSAAGEEVVVNQTTEGNQQLASVAVGPGGNFLVAWQGFDAATGTWNVYTRPFDASGSALDDETLVDQGRFPAVAVGADGEAVVAWETYDPLRQAPAEIRVRLLDALGAPTSEPEAPHAEVAGEQTAPSVARAGDRLAVLWTVQAAEDSGDVVGMLFQTGAPGQVNHAPAIELVADQTIAEGETLSLTLRASDGDDPPDALTFSLDASAPASAVLDPASGRLTWTPGEVDGPAQYTFVVRVTDNGTPPLSDATAFAVLVEEINQAPVLSPIADQSATEGTELSLLVTASDPDEPANRLTFSLAGAVPDGARIDPDTGQFTWTPGEGQGAREYVIAVRVTDDGDPPLSDVEAFTVTVGAVNQAPVLDSIADQIVTEGDELTLQLSATDGDDPPDALTFSLNGDVSAGMEFDTATGLLRWTPGEADGPGAYLIVARVTDDGSPPLSDSQTFLVTVEEANQAPILEAIEDRNVTEGSPLSFLVKATDPDLPPNALAFALIGDVPEGAAIDPAMGLFTWTPAETQGPGTYTIAVEVTDDGSPPLSAVGYFQVTVEEFNERPTLEPVGEQTIAEGCELILTVSATDPDDSPGDLRFSLVGEAPAGAAIDSVSGVFRWTPGEEHGPGTYSISVQVSDDGSPAQTDVGSFDVIVTEVNLPPTLGAIGPQNVFAGETLRLTATADDPDKPAQALTYSLDPGAPSGAAIDAATGQFVWTTPTDLAPGTYEATIVVTDDGSPTLSASQTVAIEVGRIQSVPVDWGIVDFLETTRAAADGARYLVEPVRDGRLTVETRFAHAAGDIDIALLDADETVLAASSGNDDDERVDALVQAGRSYQIEVTGSNPAVVFRLANLVVDGDGDGAVTVFGTAASDTFALTLSDTPEVTVNGIVYRLDPGAAPSIVIQGRGGEDGVTIAGTPADETVSLRPGAGEINTPGQTVYLDGVATIEMTGGGGSDVALVDDSSGDDRFLATAETSTLSGAGYSIRLHQFGIVHAYARYGGHDTAELHGSPGDDDYLGLPEFGWIRGASHFARAKFFDEVTGYAGSGGADQARLKGSDGDDHFTATPEEASISGPGYSHRAFGFATARGYANGGAGDVAQLYDSPGDDRFDATPAEATLSGGGFELVAIGFDYAHGYATAGGTDIAQLYDSPGDDQFVGTPVYGRLMGEGYLVRAKHFDYAHAYAVAGGRDVAVLHDSAGHDRFYGRPDYCWLRGDGFFNRAKFFEEVYAPATSGYDRADFIDSALADLLEADKSWARLSNAELAFLYQVGGFDAVSAKLHADDSTAVAPGVGFLSVEVVP